MTQGDPNAASLPDTEDLHAPEREAAERAAAFVRDHLRPLSEAHPDDAEALRAAVINASRDAGLFTMTQSREFGGSEASTAELVVAREQLARSGLPARRHVFGPAPGVLAGTRGALRAATLDAVMRGDKRSAFAFTDARDAITVARRSDGGWRLDGIKSYVTGGSSADLFTVVARIAEDGSEPGRAALLCVLERAHPGLTVSAPFESMDGSRHTQLTLDGVQVTNEQLIGEPGQGLPRAQRQIGDVRLTVAAEACGTMACALDHLEARLMRPAPGGGSHGDREGVRLRFADARIDAFAARSMLLRTARLADAGVNVINEGIATKVFATEAAGRVVDAALQLDGAGALVRGHLLERLYREVRALRFTEGASDVLRLNLARGRLDLGKGRL